MAARPWGAPWEDWLSKLPEHRRMAALGLVKRFTELGADDAAGWGRSQIDEDFSQLGRYLMLRATWRRMRDTLDETWRSDVTQRLIAEGVDERRLRRLLQVALGRLAFDMLYLLDEPDGTSYDDEYHDVGERDPRWRLMEVDPIDDTLTGRDIGGLHESWGQLDPDGNEGADWC